MSPKRSSGLPLASIPMIAQPVPTPPEMLPAPEQKHAHTARHRPRRTVTEFSDTDPATAAVERAIRKTLAHVDDLPLRVAPRIEIPQILPRPRESHAEDLDAMRAVMKLSNSL